MKVQLTFKSWRGRKFPSIIQYLIILKSKGLNRLWSIIMLQYVCNVLLQFNTPILVHIYFSSQLNVHCFQHSCTLTPEAYIRYSTYILYSKHKIQKANYESVCVWYLIDSYCAESWVMLQHICRPTLILWSFRHAMTPCTDKHFKIVQYKDLWLTFWNAERKYCRTSCESTQETNITRMVAKFL